MTPPPSRRARSLLGALLLLALTLGRAAAQDGTLVDASVVSLPADTPRPELNRLLADVEVRRITYLSDGLKVKGYLAMPRDAARLPCVIVNRGGNREFGSFTDARAAALLGRIASWGYVVVASQYRGNAGGEGREEFGGRDVADVLNLLPLLDSVPQADATRVGMWGKSRGGMMTYLALARTDRIGAAIVDAGVADAFDTIARRPEMETEVFAQLVPDYPANKEAALRARSAVRWPERLHKKTPILLLHGSADWRVHPGEALAMAGKLLETKHPFRLVLFEGGDHGLSEHREEADRLAREWLNRYVRDRTPWPSLEPHGP